VERAYLGIDVGTSGCKAVVVDQTGSIAATAWATYPTRRRLDGEVTQDARDWLAAVRQTMRDCAAATPSSHRIGGIGLTAPAHVGVLVGDDDEPLARCMLAFDGRSARVADDIRARLGRDFAERTMVELSSAWTLPQLAWLHERQPELWSGIRHFLTQKDFIRLHLTGVAAIDPSDATGTAMYDPRDGRWLDEARDELGFEDAWLPPVLPATDVSGGLAMAWARDTGIKAGTPVAIGATDTAAELVSVGATHAGSSHIKVASTGTVVVVTDAPLVDRRVLTYPHAIDGRWYTLAATNTAATAYAWLRETISSPEGDDYAAMDRLAARVPPGSAGLLFVPFLEGERTPYWDRDLRAAFVGLTSAHDRGHLCRAVLEGVAFSLRTCAETIEALGASLDRPSLGGGGMASPLWRSIVLAVLGRSATVRPVQGPAIGAAMLAAEAVGDREAARPSRVRRTVRPRNEWRATYDELFTTYLATVEALRPIDHSIAREAVTA
jgi:xylulokinase